MPWGAATQGWMMDAVIGCNVLGFAAGASLQGLIANAADQNAQGQAMGAVAGLSSLTAVIAPIIGPLVLQSVANAPRGDWRLGLLLNFNESIMKRGIRRVANNL